MQRVAARHLDAELGKLAVEDVLVGRLLSGRPGVPRLELRALRIKHLHLGGE